MAFLFGQKTPKVQAVQTPAVSNLNIQTSVYGKAIPIIYGTTRIAPNLIWFGDFTSISHTTEPASAPSGGGGGKGGIFGGGGGSSSGAATTTYTYTTALACALGEGPIVGVGNCYVNKNVQSAASLGFSTFTGSYPQTAWSYLTTNHSAQALGYNGLAYVAASTYDLGSSSTLPNHNFEVQGIYSNSVSAQVDADPSLVVADLLSNLKYGAGFPSSRIGSLTNYQNYTLAAGLLISPAYDTQQQASTILDDIAKGTNSEFVWSSGLLTIVPYGDTALSGNGKMYTPPAAANYDLTDDDFVIASAGDDPILCTRKRPSDSLNSFKLEYLDRSNNYNAAIIEAKDQNAIDLYGLRQNSTTNTHLYCDPTMARTAVQLLIQRQLIRNIYTFTTTAKYIRLDPMDIVSLTDSKMGLNKQWVRILEIQENDDFTFTFTAEEYLGGTGNAATYNFAQGSGYAVDYNSAPGTTNTPIIFEAPVQLATASGLETWVIASGQSNWGGCDVFVSSDGNTYKIAGRINGAARQGVLSAILPIGVDPDVTNTLHVDLTESNGSLLSGTQQDADLGHTLCYVDGELISYETATLTATNKYDLTYLRRGMYGTTIASHANGSNFGRLDAGVFIYPYDKSQIGKTFYIKLLPFNVYGGGQQTLADVPFYTHTIAGPPPPPNVTGFQAQQKGNVVSFGWDQVSDFALKGYDIGFAVVGTTNWSNFEILTEAAKGTEMTNAAVPPGAWVFGIRARDIADQLSPAAQLVNLTVTNEDQVITSDNENPTWTGTSSNLYLHWSGVLVPLGTKNCDQYSAVATPSAPSTSTTIGGSLSIRTYYVKVTLVDSTGETLASSETIQAVPALSLLVVTAPAGSGSATGWNVYVDTVSGSETKQSPSTLQLSQMTWTEPVTGLISGAAVPSINNTGWQVFDVFVPDVVASCYYISNTIDTGFVDTLRIWSADTLIEGPRESGTPSASTLLDAWTTGSDPAVYIPWTIGEISMRYANMKLLYLPVQGSVAYISTFGITIDRTPIIEGAGSVTIAPGGTIITFPQQYHLTPFVYATPVASTALYATVVSISTTQCTIHVWNNSGSDVGGVVNWSSTGE